MEPKATKFGIVSKKKNYDSTTDPELVDQFKTLDENIIHVSLSGNSYSITFCEEFGAELKKLKRLEVIYLSSSPSHSLILDCKLQRYLRRPQERRDS